MNYESYHLPANFTAEGKLLVADPVSYGKSQQEWDAEIVFNESSRNNAANGPFWVVG